MTRVVTLTRAPTWTVVRTVALVDGRVRRLAQQIACLIVVAPSAVGGFDRPISELSTSAAIATGRMVVSRRRLERR
jgi:hypothetical protein